MDNIMDTLITDRTQADVDRARYLNSLWDPRALQWRGTPQERAEWEAGPRGAYGFADMNRVTQAAAYLIGQLEELGYSVDVEDVTPAYNIRVSVDPAGGGVASGAGAYYEGDTATVTAQAGGKYDFAGWKENGQLVSEDAAYTFTVTGPRNLTAAFALKKFRVTVSVDPPGAGEVTGAGTYDIDTEVTVAATAGDGHVFARWTEGGETVSDGPQYTFTLDRDRSLSAVMTKTYVVSVTANDADGGTVSGGGTYLDGQTVTVAAVAGDGYEFAGWSEGGTAVSTEAVYTFQVAADRALVAAFVKTHVITLLVDPAGSGTALGGGTYREGAQVTISAAAGDDYHFASWQSGGEQVSTSNPYTLTVAGDQTLTALFEEIPVYTITATIDPEGGGSVTGAGQYQEGATVTLVATPADGYEFTGWQEAGQTVSESETYTFAASSNRALIGVFELAGKLPKGYTELQYVTSSGKLCGFKVLDSVNSVDLLKTRVTIDTFVYPYVANAANEELLLIAISPTQGLSIRRTSDTQIKYAVLSSGYTTKSLNISNKRVLIDLNIQSKYISFNNSKYSVSPLTAMIYSMNVPGNANQGSSAKMDIYSIKIYGESVLRHDYVPCTNESGTPGLYDTITKTFASSYYGGATPGPAV